MNKHRSCSGLLALCAVLYPGPGLTKEQKWPQPALMDVYGSPETFAGKVIRLCGNPRMPSANAIYGEYAFPSFPGFMVRGLTKPTTDGCVVGRLIRNPDFDPRVVVTDNAVLLDWLFEALPMGQEQEKTGH